VWLRRAVPVVAGLLTICFLLASVAEVWLRLGDVAVAQGRLARADSAYNHARAFRPWDPDLPAQALHQFVADATAGNAAAIPYAKKWVTGVGAVADDEQVRHNRAALLDAEADYAAALRLLTTQLRTDPYNPMFLTLRGVVEAQLSDYAGARRDLELSTRVDPSDAQAWHDLVIVYNALGDADLAAIASRKEKQLTR
jgi:tetratricopeptide (TPR) repeat protein